MLQSCLSLDAIKISTELELGELEYNGVDENRAFKIKFRIVKGAR